MNEDREKAGFWWSTLTDGEKDYYIKKSPNASLTKRYHIYLSNLLDFRDNLCERFLKNSNEDYDDYEYDGQELKVYLKNELIESYNNKTLSEVITGWK